MTEIAFNQVVGMTFLPLPGGVLGLNFSDTNGTLSDDDTDPAGTGSFETGDGMIATAGPAPVVAPGSEYLGTVVLDGITFVLVGDPAEFASPVPGHTFYAFGTVPDPANFGATYTGANGTTIPFGSVQTDTVAFCFSAGTLIATPEGESKVETLQIGDLVTTADGQVVPVRWIGRQTVQRLFSGDSARPVRICAGGLGDGLPHSDLVLTADHALIIDDLAITAGALVNGTSITRDPAPFSATYFHVETEGHEVILANGAPAETFVDYAQRRGFDNYADYVALYGDDRTIAEMPLPRISAARLVPHAIKARLGLEQAA